MAARSWRSTASDLKKRNTLRTKPIDAINSVHIHTQSTETPQVKCILESEKMGQSFAGQSASGLFSTVH